MTAKEVIKDLQQILNGRNGRDYHVIVWTGVGQTHRIELVQLVETNEHPDADHIGLQTPSSCRDLEFVSAGLELEIKPELRKPELN
jgi:hypothetical protein